MTGAETVAFILFAFLASLTQRVTGFGFGIMIMTVLPYLMPSYAEATALSGTLAIVAALFSAVEMRRYVNVRRLVLILVTFLVVSYFAVFLVHKADGGVLKKALGAVLILASLYFFLLNGKFRLKPSATNQVALGTVSGMMGGLFAMQGPPAVIYFIASSYSKEEYIAQTQWFFLIGNAAMTLYRAGRGFLTPVVGKYWCFGVVAVLLGLWVGEKVFNKMNTDVLRKVVYAFLAVAGVITLLT